MSSTPHRKTEIRRSLEMLAQVTHRDALRDNASMIEAQRQFQTLRDEITDLEQPALMLLASLGERLAGYLYKEDRLSGEALRPLVAEIAEHITKDIHCRLDPSRSLKRRTNLTLSAGEVTLALRDGQRLGELLVKMTMLTPDQVEEAVKVQRSTGQRLGEALLQMRLLTPDMLESALRLQKKKRAVVPFSDPWSPHYSG